MIEQKPRRGIYAPLFALWTALGSIAMMFGALTSAYLVRQAAGNWLEFRIPDVFYYSTVIILISSLTLHGSYWAFRKGKETLYKALLPLSLLFGILFIVMQYQLKSPPSFLSYFIGKCKCMCNCDRDSE